MNSLAIFASIFIFAVTNASTAQAENWHKIGGDESGVVEVELDTLHNYIAYKEAWWRINFHVNGGFQYNNSGEKIWYAKIHQKFNCLTSRTEIDAIGQSGPDVYHNVDVPKDKQAWSPIDPSDHASVQLFAYICGK